MGGKRHGGARAGSGRKRDPGTFWKTIEIGLACEEEAARRTDRAQRSEYEARPKTIRIREVQAAITRDDARHYRPPTAENHWRLFPRKFDASDPYYLRRSTEIDKIAGQRNRSGIVRSASFKPVYVGREQIKAKVARQFGVSKALVDLRWNQYRTLLRKVRQELD